MLQKLDIEELEQDSGTSAGKVGHVLTKSGQLTPTYVIEAFYFVICYYRLA